MDKLVNCFALYERDRTLFRANEVEDHQQEKTHEEDPRKQFLGGDRRRVWCGVGDDVGHVRIPLQG
jgi:hypothetical protein